MKHKHDEEEPPSATQVDVDGAIASGLAATHLPPDSEEMKAGHALLGRGVRVCIARMLTVILCNYDLDSNSYWGKVVNADKAEAGSPFKDGDLVPGLKAYPCTDRPSYAYQFVFPGSDESVLVNIANDNLKATHGGTGEVTSDAP